MKFSDMVYERIDFETVKSELQLIMEESERAQSGEEEFAVHKKYYSVMNRVETMADLAMIRHDCNTKDKFYSQEQDYYDKILPEIESLSQRYLSFLYHSQYRNDMEDKIGKVAFRNIELRLKSFDENIIGLLQEENELKSKYDNLIADAKIEFHGEILNISLLRKYLVSNDREIRRTAHQKETEFFLSIADELDSIYDALVKNRAKQAKSLGYDNFVKLGYYRIGRNCYDQKMVEQFRIQVKEYVVPFVAKLQEKRRKRLGLSKLSFIDEDVYFPNGNPAPIGSPEEILASGKQMYGELSKETKEFFEFMTENQLFDVFGRKDKKAGGYQTNLPDFKSPFIFANFNGTSGDIDVITHECGHAFQAYLARDMEIKEHQEITMETAEVHSMSMEFFTEPYMELFFGEKTIDYIQMHLEDSITFIPYGCMVDEFQHVIYEHPELSAGQRKDVWMELEKVYRPYLDYEEDQFFGTGGRWQKQAHIYDLPFYYIDYCLAMTCALQFKVKMDENYQEAWDSYLSLCKTSASGFFVDMVKEAGLCSPFEQGTIKDIIEKCGKYKRAGENLL